MKSFFLEEGYFYGVFLKKDSDKVWVKLPVKAISEFKMFEFDFALIKHPTCGKYAVLEKSSGFGIYHENKYKHETKVFCIEQAKWRLKSIGGEITRKAIKDKIEKSKNYKYATLEELE
jgi:hypothetical protein